MERKALFTSETSSSTNFGDAYTNYSIAIVNINAACLNPS
jgi:hypothetical protein